MKEINTEKWPAVFCSTKINGEVQEEIKQKFKANSLNHNIHLSTSHWDKENN